MRHPVVIATLIGVLAFWVYLASGNLQSPGDAIPAEILPIAILKHHTLCLDDVTHVGPGNQLPFYLARSPDGRLISYYTVLPGLLNVPTFVAADWLRMDLHANEVWLSKITAAAIAAISVVLMYLCIAAVSTRVRTAILMTSIFAFGTTVYSVASQALWQHGPAILFLTAAMALLLRPQSRLLPLAGLMLGLAVCCRPATVVYALPATAFILIHHRNRLWSFLLWAAIPAVLLGLYSHFYWGSIWRLGQGHTYAGWQGPYRNAFDAPWTQSIPGLLWSPGRGLFVHSPVFLFSFPLLLWFAIRSPAKPAFRYLAIGALLYLLLIGKWRVWWGGSCYAYRMLSEMSPVLVLFLAVAWDKLSRRRYMQVIFWPLAAVTMYIHFLGAAYFDDTWNKYPQVVDSHQERLWDWRDPQVAYFQKRFFKARGWSDGDSRG